MARATMQNPAMAKALSIRTAKEPELLCIVAFGLGAGLAGASGALLAPATSIAPLDGTTVRGASVSSRSLVVGGGGQRAEGGHQAAAF